MKKLFDTDYVIYRPNINDLLRFGDGEIIIYGNIDDAKGDLYGDEYVISCTKLNDEFKKELLKQINANE